MEITVTVQTLITVGGIIVTALSAFYAVKYGIKANKSEIDDIKKNFADHQQKTDEEIEKIHERIRTKDAKFTECFQKVEAKLEEVTKVLYTLVGKFDSRDENSGK